LPALEALRDLVAALAPVVLLLDDLQWADPGTVAALRWLRGHATGLAATVVGAWRSLPGTAGPPPPLLPADDHVRLGPLDRADCWEVARARPGLVAATGGDPLLLADAGRWAAAGGHGPSPSLRAHVRRTVRGLDGSLPTLLGAATGLAEPFR